MVDSSLPVLVTRLSDRRALARLLRAALRHEVAQVPLEEAPRQGTHTLDLRVTGSPSVSLLAEPAGAPQNGHFPLRLRPLHRAQAAELYALLEGENPSSEGSSTAPAESAAPGSPIPDTLVPRTLSYEDSGPIMRAMSGSAPPPVAEVAIPRGPTPIDPRVTAPMGWSAKRPDDPRRTAPSAAWARPVNEANVEDRRAWGVRAAPVPAADAPAPPLPSLPDDPRRTARSASWAPPPDAPRAEPPPGTDEDDGASADDPSLSVSVVFEPDMLPGAVAAATAAAIAAAKSEAADADDHDPLPADEEGRSLSVSVIFEPDMVVSTDRSPAAPRSVDVPTFESPPPTPTLATGEEEVVDSQAAAELARDGAHLAAASDATEAHAGNGSGDFFFDEDFAKMPLSLIHI